MPEKHLSTQFDSELNSVSSRVMELGGLVESQIRQAIYALSHFSLEAVEQVGLIEQRVNGMEVEIDHELASIIGRRQPTARDLRQKVSDHRRMPGRVHRMGEPLDALHLGRGGESDTPCAIGKLLMKERRAHGGFAMRRDVQAAMATKVMHPR